MSDIGADNDAAIEMVEKAEDRLFALNPDHELISYLRIKSKAEREKEWQKLLRRFSRNPDEKGNVRGAMETTYALSKYLIALEVALGERNPSKEEEKSVSDEEQSSLSEATRKERMCTCACGREYDPGFDSHGFSRRLNWPEKCGECNSEAVNVIVENDYRDRMKNQ